MNMNCLFASLRQTQFNYTLCDAAEVQIHQSQAIAMQKVP